MTAPQTLCAKVRERVPSAKPSRMKGMSSQDDRTALCGDHIPHWHEDRLLAVLPSLGYRARLVVERVESPAG